MKLSKTIKEVLFEMMALDQVEYELLGYQVWFLNSTNKFYEELEDIPQGFITKIMQVGKKRKRNLPELYQDAKNIYSIDRKF